MNIPKILIHDQQKIEIKPIYTDVESKDHPLTVIAT